MMGAEEKERLLDALVETSVYVIEEESHRLLYLNKRCREQSGGRARLGVKCHEIWPELCAKCPLKELGTARSCHIVCFDPLQKITVDLTANRVLWGDKIPAVVITSTPHRLDFREAQGLEKIEQMYAQSLMTVFGECIIANLTADYYVNCQKDGMWSEIPEQGNFEAENQKYSRIVMHPDDLAAFDNAFSRQAMLRLFTQGKKQISRRLRRLSGSGEYRMVEFTATRINPADKEIWCVLVFRDIQEEYQLEEQRSMEVTQLATAIKTAFQMLISVNLTKNTYHFLEYERLGVEQPAWEGCFCQLLETEAATVHPDYREEFIRKFSRDALCDAFTNGARIVKMEVPHRGGDGEYHWYFTQVVRVENPHMEDIIEITLSRNIDSERRMREEALEKERRTKALLEDALKKAEKASRAKSEFLSRMSHDIRTPMNAIVGLTELAGRHVDDREKMQNYLKQIADAGAHLLDLINEVLDVGKIESGEAKLALNAFDLRELIQETVEMLQVPVRKKGQRLSVFIDDAVHSRVTGDDLRLKQILMNILENASKYTGEGGSISLSLEELTKKEDASGTYRFIIEDTGIGMKPQYLSHIFEPFSRAEDLKSAGVTGTGLGMTIVKNLVALMDGDIQVESEYGKGSRFTITICLAKNDAPSLIMKEKEEGREESFEDFRILLAEDNALNRQIAGEMLELLGARVEMAEDGEQAVNAVRSHPPLYYHLVLMDIQMPKLNGYEAARRIRSLDMERIDELPIIALTADAFAEDVKRAHLAGMNGHLAKPISIDRLRQTLSGCRAWRQKNIH